MKPLLLTLIGSLLLPLCLAAQQPTTQDEMSIEETRKLAEQGDAAAQTSLGLRYYNGEEVEQDYKQAMEWFRKAADQGEARAQFLLGIMYYYGEEVAQDYKQAAYWVEKAYNNGYEEAADFWNQMELEQYK